MVLNSPDKTLNAVDLELPEWIVYVIIAVMLLIGVLVVLFLKKSDHSRRRMGRRNLTRPTLV